MSYKKLISKVTGRNSSDSSPTYNANENNHLNTHDLLLRTQTGSHLRARQRPKNSKAAKKEAKPRCDNLKMALRIFKRLETVWDHPFLINTPEYGWADGDFIVVHVTQTCNSHHHTLEMTYARGRGSANDLDELIKEHEATWMSHGDREDDPHVQYELMQGLLRTWAALGCGCVTDLVVLATPTAVRKFTLVRADHACNPPPLAPMKPEPVLQENELPAYAPPSPPLTPSTKGSVVGNSPTEASKFDPLVVQEIKTTFLQELSRAFCWVPTEHVLRLDDTRKRSNLLIDHLEDNDLLQPDTVAVLLILARALKAKDYE